MDDVRLRGTLIEKFIEVAKVCLRFLATFVLVTLFVTSTVWSTRISTH